MPFNQKRTDTSPYVSAILENTPNGILLVDKDTRIQYVNPSFKKMFKCGDKDLLGKPAKEFVHSDCFKRTIEKDGNLMVRENVKEHNVSFRAGLFPIDQDEMYCGIFIDISEEEEAKKHYRELKAQTLERAQEVINRQMETAQEIARLLGETTSDTKVLLVKLMSLFEEEKEK